MTTKHVEILSSKKTSVKHVAKRAAKKVAVRHATKPASRKAVVKKAAKKLFQSPPPGYIRSTSSDLFVPSSSQKNAITPASKLRDGIKKAQSEIKQSLQEIASLMTMDFAVSEIEFSVSFSADGKFLGFGVGGAASIKVKIKPVENDE
jgi:hypothetical protein